MGFDELVQHDLSEMTDGIGNGLTGGNGSPVGIAGGGVGNSELDNSDAFTFNGDLTLAQGSQDYTLKARSGIASFQGESSNSFAGVEIITGDADGTENAEFTIWGLKQNGLTDRERVRLRYNSAFLRGEVQTEAGGTGSEFPLHVFVAGNANQFVARTDGNVAMANNLLVGSTGAATNALGVSGGAVVGSGYAGSNTAPTDGLLVEGNLGVQTTNPLNTIHARDGAGDQLRLGGSDSEGRLVLGTFVGGNGAGRSILNAVDGTGGGRPEINIQVGSSTHLKIDDAGRTIVQPTTTKPGSSSDAIFRIGSSGAGLYVDSNEDIVARDGNGNTTVLT